MRGRLLMALALTASLAAPASGAGFGIFEQGSKAMGMAGAFTAQADDPSAMFHNVGGLAFLDEREFSVGATYITNTEAEFQGLNPFPGTGVRAEQETLSEFPPHLYYVQPISDALRFGLAVNSPFGLTTEWENPATFVGRFLSTRAALRVLDLSPNLGWQVNPRLGIGFGAIARFSDVELERRVAQTNPATLQPADVAAVRLESDFDEGFGWQAGLLHRYNNSFSWGFSYRSKVKVEYAGDGRFTQIPTGFPQFDALVAAAIPFGQALPVETEVEFPDMASLGVAIALSPNALLEVDANWTGWSSFDRVAIDFPGNPQFSDVIPEDWEDVYNYRVGLRWPAGTRGQLRLGYVFDETPQPDTSVSPLLPDADRNGFTVGYGFAGHRFQTDLALMYLAFDERTTRTNDDDFNGTYNTTAWLLGATLGW